ncbi:p-hydroxycinnamoyl CoA hydratase/lyase [Alicyclobacillus sp. ALC3]|uniref:p-hydroxycinnamoyl CoA hydratase/lyase n=1 Tax=Alicyclobacillus sp. ALC3 TaxID=2796143 RepID=UPI0023786E14|nr:p-hydroxycinnamoyl CoA hydratase/lyase [Alicyclobacillus sp. ALC3]WDL97629.1 p-hydroxycinnamoyl CoA hydratase/lyase [Alicyclobacillus sp. ALC3]
MVQDENNFATQRENFADENVRVELQDGIAWVYFNRPSKKNAMSPNLNRDMLAVLEALEADDRCKVLVLTGEGDAFSAGMDLKEYFRDIDENRYDEVMRIRRQATYWQWRKLMYYPKPTIAMVNGWCFGGGLTPMIACDLAIAADEAVFGLSEINWGIIPAGNVTKAVEALVGQRNALYYIMTGETFNGQRAAEIGLVNESVPLAQLAARTTELAKLLLGKNLHIVNAAKMAYKYSREMSWDTAEEYLFAKQQQAITTDPERGRSRGLTQFLDEKSYRPGLGSYRPGLGSYSRE